MKNKTKEKKLINFKKNDIFRSFFLIFMLIFCIFIYSNNDIIQFKINGFSTIFNSDLQVYVLNVGQASASLVIFPDKTTMIIDTGDEEGKESFLSELNLIIDQNGLTKMIDYLVLTHSDEDHIGGTIDLLEEYEVRKIFRPKILSLSEEEVSVTENYAEVDTAIYAEVITAIYNEEVGECKFIEDMNFEIEDAKVEIFSCQKDFYNDTNSYSPFIKITYQTKSFLFTGDATSARERELINLDKEILTDFLIVSHHGSKYSTTEEFLNFVSPMYALISAGDKDHPSQEVLNRLNDNGVLQVLVTKDDGTIGIGISDNDISINYFTTYLDLPLIVVVLFVFAFISFEMMLKIRDRNKTIKNRIRKSFNKVNF